MLPKFLVSIFYLAIFFLSSKSFADSKNYTIENAWTELGENNHTFVRAIISGADNCPTIDFYVNSKKITQPMELRPNFTKEQFPVLVCQKSFSNKVTKIILQEKELPVVKKSPTRFLLIGDTGCRIKKRMLQNCNDENAWPFKKLTQAAIKKNPDAVIHVGDYHYREIPCPKDSSWCTNATPGDNWASWNEDFFTPAKELLYSVPVAFTRGDHESCGRAGNGWFYFLYAGSNDKECKKYTKPYKISLGTVNLLFFDSSFILDDTVNAANVTEYTKELQQLQKLKANKNNWFITHKPVWGFGLPRKKNLEEYSNELKTKELQTVVNNAPFDNSIDILLAGHIHMLQLISLGQKYPPQLVTGNSGTLTEYYEPKITDNMEIDNKKIEYTKTSKKFGYTILTIEKNHSLKAENYNLDDKIDSTCFISQRKVQCN